MPDIESIPRRDQQILALNAKRMRIPEIAKKTGRKSEYVLAILKLHVPEEAREVNPTCQSLRNIDDLIQDRYKRIGKFWKCPTCGGLITKPDCVLCTVRHSKGNKAETEYLPQGVRAAMHDGGFTHRRFK